MPKSYHRNQISRVTRSKNDARASYNRMSRWYDLLAGTSEWNYVKAGLDLLNAAEGEVILEIGYGTGKSILELARTVKESGRIYGVDLSEGMYRIANNRTRKAGLSDRVDLRCCDALNLPFDDGIFDAVFMSFTLELFDTPEIPLVLKECYRVLKSSQRMVIVSMSKKSKDSRAVQLYEWAHKKLPHYVDCRPIYAAESLLEAGFHVVNKKEMKMWGLPVDVVLARKA